MDAPAQLPPSLLERTVYLLSKTGKAARDRVRRALADADVGTGDLAALSVLADFGPTSQRQIGHHLGLDPSDLVKILEGAESRGWVERRRDPADRRRYVVTLTGDGRAVLAGARAESEAVEAAVLAGLTPAEREVLHGLLRRVLADLDPRAALG